MMRRIIAGILAGILASLGAVAHAQEAGYPNKPIRLIVPWAAGGSTDLTARAFGQFLTELWGQPVVVESRPGAGGTVGSGVTAAAEPDGYTLQLATTSHAIAPSLYKLPFDTIRDFTPIILLGEAPLFLVVHPSTGFSSVNDIITYARANPGKLNYATSGNGTSLHIASELFKQMSGTDIRHVPYRGVNPALTDVLSGRVEMMFSDVSVMPHVMADRLKVIAVASEKRSYAMPQVPTVAEAALPGYKNVTWYAVLAPKNVRPEIVAKLNAGFNQALKDKKTLDRLATFAFEPIGGTAAEFGKLLEQDVELYKNIVKAGAISID